MVSIRYFTNPLKTGDIYGHAQTVCTRPLLRGRGLGVRLPLGLPYTIKQTSHNHYLSICSLSTTRYKSTVDKLTQIAVRQNND